MKVVVLGADGLGKCTTPDGEVYMGWAGTTQGSAAPVACVLPPSDSIHLLGRLGYEVVDDYKTFIAEKYEGRVDCSYLDPMVDPRGNNAGDNVQLGETWAIRLTYRPDPIRFEDLPGDLLAEADALVFNAGVAEMYDGGLIREVKERFPHLFVYVDVHLSVFYLDENLQMQDGSWPTWRVDLALADVVQLNPHEASLMLEREPPGDYKMYPCADVIDEILSCGAKRVALTLAEHGCVVAAEDRHLWHVPGIPIANVVDPCGAGDAFGGVFLGALLTGSPLVEAAQMGCVAGAATCERIGYLTPSVLTRADIVATVNRLREEGRCWSNFASSSGSESGLESTAS